MSEPERPERTKALIDGGFWKHLGFRPGAPGRPDGPERVALTVGDAHLRSLGLMHGGVSTAMLDAVMGRAALSRAPEGHHVVTAQLNVHFIKAAQAGDALIADAHFEHVGRRTAVMRGEIRAESGELVALGTGTFMYVPIDS